MIHTVELNLSSTNTEGTELITQVGFQVNTSKQDKW